MGRQTYTVEQLLRLRESPLIKKPDGLPSIELWLEPPADQAQRKARPQTSRTDEHHSNQEEHTQRPSLFQTRHLTRNSSTAPEDVVLAPPKTLFASASANRNSRHPEAPDRSQLARTDEDASRNERAMTRDKFFRDREKGEKDADRPRDRIGNATGRRAGRDEQGGWTSSRARKGNDEDESERLEKGFDREKRWSRRPPPPLEEEGETGGSIRRNGDVKERWSRQSNPAWARESTESRKEGDKERGSRYQERQGGRDWTRGERVEREPEWMDDPEPDPKRQTRTQEDFQRWKEQMNASGGRVEDKAESWEPPLVKEEPPPGLKPEEPSRGAGLDKLFGQWGESKQLENAAPEGPGSPSRPQTTKPKSSRFAGFFAPKEVLQSRPEQPAAPPQISGTPAPSHSTEDKEGFERILQMLGGAAIGPKTANQELAPERARPVSVDAKHANPLASMFLSSNTSPSEQPDFPGRERFRQNDPFTGVWSPRFDDHSVQSSATARIQAPTEDTGRTQRAQQDPRMLEPRQGAESQTVPRAAGSSTPLSRDSEFLLKLMQQPRPPSNEPKASTGTPRQPPDPNFSIFLDEKPANAPSQAQQQKPRIVPPGFFDERYSAEQLSRQGATTQEQSNRTSYPRPPPGLFDDTAIQAKLRRQPVNDLPRQFQAHPSLGQPSGNDNLSQLRFNPPQHQEYIAPPPGFSISHRNSNVPLGFGGPTGPAYPEHMPFNPSRIPQPPNPRPNMSMPGSLHLTSPTVPPPGFGHQHFPPGMYPYDNSMPGSMRERAAPDIQRFQGQAATDGIGDLGRQMRAPLKPPAYGYGKGGPGAGMGWDERTAREYGYY